MKSVMTEQFRVPKANILRSQFDRSHGNKLTFDGGYLVPILLDEVIPGDTFDCKMDGFLRLATPINPLMDNVQISSFFFFVPMRLVWQNSKKFFGEQENPADTIDYTIPERTIASISQGDTADYLGLPLGVSVTVNDLPFRCLNLIYNEWFRDQNLQDSFDFDKGDAVTVALSEYSLKKRGKRHDYFTSALTAPQKGDSVTMPISGNAPVMGLALPNTDTGVPAASLVDSQGAVSYTTASNTGANALYVDKTSGTAGATINVYADLSSATSATINQLRQSFQIQALLEKDARGGTRYVEHIFAHFGIDAAGGDARLQRPEYLGGGTSWLNITPVAQTGETGTTAQGNLAGFGTVAMNNHGFQKSFTEHGYIIGLISANADLTYQQGVDKLWSRSTRYDFFYPVLDGIGDQAILNKEIYAQGTAADDLVFGYAERFGEYRHKRSAVNGLFKSAATGSLDNWHLAQEFTSLPLLNDSFIQDNPPIDRVIATPTEPHFIGDLYFNYKCVRPMRMHAIPYQLSRI